jgi:hypothetical protein
VARLAATPMSTPTPTSCKTPNEAPFERRRRARRRGPCESQSHASAARSYTRERRRRRTRPVECQCRKDPRTSKLNRGRQRTHVASSRRARGFDQSDLTIHRRNFPTNGLNHQPRAATMCGQRFQVQPARAAETAATPAAPANREGPAIGEVANDTNDLEGGIRHRHRQRRPAGAI